MSIFLFGNKLVDGEVVLANGVKSEFEIAVECTLFDSSCWMYRVYGERNMEKSGFKICQTFYTNVDDVLIEAFKKLNSKSSKPELIT